MGNRFLLVAINAKYIHSNLAVYSLKAYAGSKGMETELAEYTINHQIEMVLQDIYEREPDEVGFSCYIWNMDFVRELAEELHKVLPRVPIWLGGPEVSWNPEERLEEMPFVTGIMIGEGEQIFAELAAYYEECGGESGKAESDFSLEVPSGRTKELGRISGICFRGQDGQICRTSSRTLLDLDELVFPYQDLTEYANRIIYYESSRGCPFSCSYCLSSVEKKLRFRSLPLVYEELAFFLREKVAQVKFVDRTFNCRHEHSYAIWQYILEHDNGVTNFHFEIAADLLREEDFVLFARMRPGLIQLEIGVQSTNSDTIRAIGRKMDLEKVARYTERVRQGRNIHQHLDLIAGLPQENLESFMRSFNDVYAMKPDQLQLGFLKVLHGTRMEQETDLYGLVYRSHPAYEVLFTNWLSFADLLLLKQVEETVEEYYNSGQFTCTLAYIIPFFPNAFAFYSQFGAFLHREGYRSVSQNRIGRYMALRHFLTEWAAGLEEQGDADGRLERTKPDIGETAQRQENMDFELVDELLSLDFCLREKLNRVPAFIPDQEPYKKIVSDFFAREIQEGTWLGEAAKKYSYRRLRGRFQPLVFQRNVRVFMEKKDTEVTQTHDKIEMVSCLALFDYERRNVMDHNAKVIWISLEQLKEEVHAK